MKIMLTIDILQSTCMDKLRCNEWICNKIIELWFKKKIVHHCKGPCKYKKNIKIQKKFGYDTPHPPTPLSKKKKFRKISKVIYHEYLYIEARTKA